MDESCAVAEAEPLVTEPPAVPHRSSEGGKRRHPCSALCVGLILVANVLGATGFWRAQRASPSGAGSLERREDTEDTDTNAEWTAVKVTLENKYQQRGETVRWSRSRARAPQPPSARP